MHKQRAVRTSLIAAISVLALFAIPAAAQAHHIDTSAKCELVGNTPTVSYTVTFVGFSASARDHVNGTVKKDGTTVRTVTESGGITWNGSNGTLAGTTPGTAGAAANLEFAFTWPSGSEKEKRTTGECPAPKNPDIALDKTGAATANAGETFTYSFKATNTGDVTLENVVLTDDKCQSTLTRTEPNLADQTFDPGDEWFYTCTVIAPAGPATVDNLAEVCGDYVPPKGPTVNVCDEDTHTFTVPPPVTPPVNPPVTPPGDTPPGVTPPGTTPPSGSGEVLPEEALSGRAVLRGPSGCSKTAFTARVSGRSIASVTFSIDGRKVKTVGKGAFTLKIQPKKFGVGRHQLIAVVKFTKRSGTANRRLPLTFRRCAQGVVAPRFTG